LDGLLTVFAGNSDCWSDPDDTRPLRPTIPSSALGPHLSAVQMRLPLCELERDKADARRPQDTKNIKK